MSAQLWEPYDSPDARGPRLHVRDGNGFRGVTHHEWNAAALRVAGNLRRRGVGAKTYVGCLLTNTFDVCAAVPGTWLAGGVVVSLPTLSRGLDPHAYGAQILRLCRLSGIELLLVEAQFLLVLTELMGPATGVRVEAFESLTDGDPIEEADPPGRRCHLRPVLVGKHDRPKGMRADRTRDRPAHDDARGGAGH